MDTDGGRDRLWYRDPYCWDLGGSLWSSSYNDRYYSVDHRIRLSVSFYFSQWLVMLFLTLGLTIMGLTFGPMGALLESMMHRPDINLFILSRLTHCLNVYLIDM